MLADYGIYYSSDSGATWLQATGAPTGIYTHGIAASASGQAMVAAVYESKRNFYSLNIDFYLRQAK